MTSTTLEKIKAYGKDKYKQDALEALLNYYGKTALMIITRLKRDNYLSLDTIEKICNTLHCGVDDILEFYDENKDGQSND